jgi:predicted AlkP superfamily pyrophosphatase or phosphodiesterase
MDDAERPSFVGMYFDQPDSAMHLAGPHSDAVNSALIYVDAMINYLLQQLDNNVNKLFNKLICLFLI